VFSVQRSAFGGPVFAFQATTDKPTGQVEVGVKEARGKREDRCDRKREEGLRPGGKKVSPPLESANKKIRKEKIEIRK